ncbi:MAG: DUF4364 family protein [Clostridiaceae bacterium]
MFDDTIDLAENKLLLLYIFRALKMPVSRNLITEIVLENNFINYFILQQYLSELKTSFFIEDLYENENHRLKLTDNGVRALNFFENRISEDKKHTIDNYIANNMNNIKNEISIAADYTIENTNSYLVNLRAIENNITLLDLKLSVPTNKQARDLCAKWKENSSALYNKIISLLIEDN